MPQNYNACSPAGTPPTTAVNNTPGTLGYPIGFPYIAATDIVVFTGETGNWTLRNQGTGANEYAVNPQTGLGTDQVVFVGATPGTNIMITRRTDLCAAARVFQAGASIRAQDLNTDMNQLRFLIQELNSWLEMFVGNEGDELVPGEFPSANQLGLQAGDGIEFTGNNTTTIAVDLANDDPGLQFDANDDLQVIGNTVTNTANPVLQNGPSEVTIQSGGGITITGSGSDTVTISSVAGAGGLTFEGTVNVSVAMAGDFLTATQGHAWTADTACGGQGEPAIHASWITALANVANGDSVDVGDIIACSTNAPPVNRQDQFSRIPVGGGFGNLQTVTNNGSSTTNDITFQTGANVNTQISGDGSAVFNERGQNVDFRVERVPDGQNARNALLVNADTLGNNNDQYVQLESTAIIHTDQDQNNNTNAALTIGQLPDGTNANHMGFYYGSTIDAGNPSADIFSAEGDLRIRVNGAGAQNNTDTIDFINADWQNNNADVSIRPDDSSILLSRTKYRETGGGANFLQMGVNGEMANDITWNLPTDLPADNQILKVNGVPAGNVVNLAWEADTGGGGQGGGQVGAINDVQVARLVDQKAVNTAGGASVAGWQVRTLNTEVYDDDGLVALSGTNGFTLEPGEYLIEWSAPAYKSDRHQTALSTSTNAANIIALGSSEYNQVNNTSSEVTTSKGSFKVNINAAQTYHILHYIESAAQPNGLGVQANNGQAEIYTQVNITNLAGVTVNAAGDVNHITYNGAAAWATVDRSQRILSGLNFSRVELIAQNRYRFTFATRMPNSNYTVVCNTNEYPPYGAQPVYYCSTIEKTPEHFIIATQTSVIVGLQCAVFSLNALPPKGTTGTDAWADVNADGTVNGSFNCTVTKTGAANTSVYEVVFNSPMPSDDYAVVGSVQQNFSAVFYVNTGTKTAQGFTYSLVNSVDGSTPLDGAASFTVNATNAVLPATITEDQIAALIQNPVLSAWCDVTPSASANTAGTINNSFNIRSVTTSSYNAAIVDVVFETPMSDANYSVVGSTFGVSGQSAVNWSVIDNKTAQGFSFALVNVATGAAPGTRSFFQVVGTARNGTLGGGADAWGNINGATGTANASFNCTTSRTGPGTYVVTFDTPMPNANYSVVATADDNTHANCVTGNLTANSFNIYTAAVANPGAGNFDVDKLSFAVFATDGNAGGFWQSTGVQGSANQVLSPLNPQADVQVPSLNSGPLAGLRNRIINGCGSATGTINQRSYVSGTATTAANEYTIDRWRVVTSGENLSWADANNIRTLTAPAGGVEQIIEGANITAGQYTLSWTGTATATVAIGAGVAAAVANGGQVTITAAQSGSNVTVRLINGTFHSVQFEPGPVATPFEHRPIGTELALCQRYFIRQPNNAYLWQGDVTAGNIYAFSCPLPVSLRIAPPEESITNITSVASNNFGVPVLNGNTSTGSIVLAAQANANGNASFFFVGFDASAEF